MPTMTLTFATSQMMQTTIISSLTRFTIKLLKPITTINRMQAIPTMVSQSSTTTMTQVMQVTQGTQEPRAEIIEKD
jgi:hypothetical protein